MHGPSPYTLLIPMRRHILVVLVALAGVVPSLRAQTPPPAGAGDSVAKATPAKRAPRRQEVTPELDRTAFATARARELLGRARIARMAQDSALRSYQAKAFQRIDRKSVV